MFAVGDKVLYPMHGAAVIKNVEQKQIDGHAVNYFVLKMLLSDMKVMIPEVNVDKIGLRPIVNKKILPKVEDVLKARPENKMKRITWNRRYNMYVDKMKTGDIFEVADVVRTLAVQETEKKLSAGERRLLTTAKQILLSEFMLVESVDEEKSEKWLDQFV
ncbi:CarD family transcriptional regulator [Acidaminococcus sp. LBK-2]|uniref:CarD family transcriptional regulator n=1 Tax=Acidaminococcus TaxID=904 RepID=UPI0024313C0D|nr:CarD family transcriptional regulator [Acidaminococcus fermentans]